MFKTNSKNLPKNIVLKRELKKELDHVYITTDGKKWVDKEQATFHQVILDRIEIC